MAELKEVSSYKSFDGYQKVFSHSSKVCNCTMKFGIYIPFSSTQGTASKFPVLYVLPGRTYFVEQFVEMTSYKKYASENKLVVVVCDTSPRDVGPQTGPQTGPQDVGSNSGPRGAPRRGRGDRITYGPGAGMYMDAITPGWEENYKMFSYVTQELIEVVEHSFDFVHAGRRGIVGHSMGGHGSLLCALKRPDLYMSVSSISPVCNAARNERDDVPGSYEMYLGKDKDLWYQYDVYELMKAYQGKPLDLLVYLGTRDRLWSELKIWQLVKATHGKDNINVDLKMRAGYGHDHDFVESVIGEHIEYHANILNVRKIR